MENDLKYYKRRSEEEFLAAERADSPEAQQSHRQLAERYATIVEQNESLSFKAAPMEVGATD